MIIYGIDVSTYVIMSMSMSQPCISMAPSWVMMILSTMYRWLILTLTIFAIYNENNFEDIYAIYILPIKSVTSGTHLINYPSRTAAIAMQLD
jgi:hypothetical protein